MNLPSRLTEKSFRKYEKDIAKAVKEWPNPVTFKPTGNSVVYAARMRDAMLSLFRYKWTTEVDMTLFLTIYHEDRTKKQLHVFHAGDEVHVGGQYPDLKAEEQQETAVVDPTKTIEVQMKELETKKIVCQLVAAKAVVVPIKAFGISIDESQWLEENYDVLVKLNEDGSHTIV